MRLTGLPFTTVAPAAEPGLLARLPCCCSTVSCAGTTSPVRRLVRRRLAMCTFMAAPALQMAYTESLALLLVCLALTPLRTIGTPASPSPPWRWRSTRPIALALVPVVAAHWLGPAPRHGATHRFRTAERWRVARCFPGASPSPGLAAGRGPGHHDATPTCTPCRRGRPTDNTPGPGLAPALLAGHGVSGWCCAPSRRSSRCLRPASRGAGLGHRRCAPGRGPTRRTCSRPRRRGRASSGTCCWPFPLMWPVPDLLASRPGRLVSSASAFRSSRWAVCCCSGCGSPTSSSSPPPRSGALPLTRTGRLEAGARRLRRRGRPGRCRRRGAASRCPPWSARRRGR